MTIFKIAAVAVTAVMFSAVLRRGNSEFALLMLLAAGLWMLMLVFDELQALVDMLTRLTRLAQLDGLVLEPVMKTLLLSILTRVTCEVCRSSGEGGVAAFVEVAGTVLALAASLPLCDAVVHMIARMLS